MPKLKIVVDWPPQRLNSVAPSTRIETFGWTALRVNGAFSLKEHARSRNLTDDGQAYLILNVTFLVTYLCNNKSTSLLTLTFDEFFHNTMVEENPCVNVRKRIFYYITHRIVGFWLNGCFLILELSCGGIAKRRQEETGSFIDRIRILFIDKQTESSSIQRLFLIRESTHQSY